MIRVIRWFDKGTEKLAGDRVLYDADLSILQALFGVERDDPMYDVYKVEGRVQIAYLEELIKVPLETKLYDYFIECDAE